MPKRVTKSITVKRDVRSLYDLWANFENFPHFMRYVKSVERTGPKTSRWVVAGPLGRDVEWEAETTMLEPNARIGWSTKDRSGMTTSGQVAFNQLSSATGITVTFQYDPPAGVVGDVVAELFADPDARIDEDLRNFKAYAEGMPARSSA